MLVARACLILVLVLARLPAADTGGFIGGVVRDRSGGVVSGAQVHIQSETTGAQQKILCDTQGQFVSAELPPGNYKVTIRAHGFRTLTRPDVVVESGQTRMSDFAIELLPLQQEITVQSTSDESDPAASGLAVSRQAPAATFPANGRDLHAFYNILPGSTVTPASSGDGGQFTVNGQRPNTNTVRIDGISGNTGLGVSATPGTYPGSTLPGMTVIGSTQDLASKEEIERVELRSADFAPEYGDRPGAQISVETRGGSNEFHGGAFGYVRPGWLDSEDWFAHRYDFALPPASLNGYGGGVGGPIFHNRTFFFLATEDENVQDKALQLMPVPSLQARAAASYPYSLLLDAFPAPMAVGLNGNESMGAAALEKQASVENYSARIDQVLGEWGRLFARYNYVPSDSVTQQLSTEKAKFDWMSATLGATVEWHGIHDLRFNFSRVIDVSSWAASSVQQQAAFYAFSNPLPTELSIGGVTILGSGGFVDNGITALSIAGVGQLTSGTAERTHQDQWEGSYTFALQHGQHDFRFGADFIRLLPRTTFGNGFWTTSVVSSGVDALLAGDPLGATISEGKPTIDSGQIPIGSVFIQDTYRVNNRFNILYGLRWEITPPSNTSSSTGLFAVGSWSGPGTTFQPAGGFYGLNESSWSMHFTQLAPRLGLAYRLPRLNMIFRAGAGVFYDDALGSLLFAVNLSPFSMWEYLPVSTAASAPALGFGESPPPLSLPRVWEWRSSLEKALAGRSTVSVAYVGSVGRRLLQLDGIANPVNTVLEQTVFGSYGTSNYQALQAQYTGHLSSNLYALISYAWAHSIDTGSQISSIFFLPPGSSDANDRGSSNFDVRHNLNASLSYRIPSSHIDGFRGAWSREWNLSSTLEARTGFPFDVTTDDRSIGLGFANTGRPNLVAGVPLWIENSAVPGGRELNPAAFTPVGEFTNGTLGRNVLTGPGLFQIDASLRRQFRLFSATSLETSVNVFNLFDRGNFSSPVGYLGSALFGQPVSMQNLMLGSGTPTNGLTPIFQNGGPRTVELNLKFSF